MVKHRFFLSLALTAIVAVNSSLVNAQMIRVPTNFGNGADAEVREFSPMNRRGNDSGLATRIIDNVPGFLEPPTNPSGPTSDRSSHFYVRIDTSELTPTQVGNATDVLLQLTYRATSINQGRLQQTVLYDADGNKTTDPELAVDSVTKRVGLNFHALNIGHSGNDWIEDASHPDGIHYANAPGIIPYEDRVPFPNIGQIDIDPNQTVFLGQQDLPLRGPSQNVLPVGGQFNFSSGALTQYVNDAKAVGQDSMTFLVSLSIDGDSDFNQLTNFNYSFTAKEQITMPNQPQYNPDSVVYGDFPLLPVPGSPWSLADNSTGRFSPALVFLGIPEPSSMLLASLSLAGVALVRRRRR